MKKTILLFTIIFLTVFQFQRAYSQDDKGNRTFKIIGKTEVENPQGKHTVEYDPDSSDHLFITSYNKEGKATSKKQYLVGCKKFNLSEYFNPFYDKRDLVADGVSISSNDKGGIDTKIIYKDGLVVQQLFYYADGQQKSLIPGGNLFEGEYKMWYPNGQLSFSGNYINNLKNGDFTQFDQSGAVIKKGVYQEGKLTSGEPVVQDITYYDPDVEAKYGLGEVAFDEYLTKRVADLEIMKIVLGEKKMSANITIDKGGNIIRFQNNSDLNKISFETLKTIFKDCPDLKPATIEGVPVQSVQRISCLFSKKGIKFQTEEMIYSSVDILPEFPGGSNALMYFIHANLHYPPQEAQSRISGRVVVNFVVDINGDVKDIIILRGLNRSFNEEAIRVIKMFPKFIPGQLHGKAVNVNFTAPLIFEMQI